MRDISSDIGVVQAIAPAVQTATIASAALDLLGFGSAALIINTGAIVGAGDFTAKLQESNTSTAGDFTDVAAGNLRGSLPASLAASSVYKVGYVTGLKRYVRVVLTANGGTSIAASAVLVRGNARERPVT